MNINNLVFQKYGLTFDASLRLPRRSHLRAGRRLANGEHGGAEFGEVQPLLGVKGIGHRHDTRLREINKRSEGR